MNRSCVCILLAVFIFPWAHARADEPLAKAKQFFEDYTALEKKFDPALADLYSDDAKIQNFRVYPGRGKQILRFPPLTYKRLIREGTQPANEGRATNTYSDVNYAVEGARVRITATRVNDQKKLSSPLSLLVGPAENGKWLIFEETSESPP